MGGSISRLQHARTRQRDFVQQLDVRCANRLRALAQRPKIFRLSARPSKPGGADCTARQRRTGRAVSVRWRYASGFSIAAVSYITFSGTLALWCRVLPMVSYTPLILLIISFCYPDLDFSRSPAMCRCMWVSMWATANLSTHQKPVSRSMRAWITLIGKRVSWEGGDSKQDDFQPHVPHTQSSHEPSWQVMLVVLLFQFSSD